MEYIVTAILTAIFTAGFILLYKYVINPQMIIKPSNSNMAKCPDMWDYNESMKRCVPKYDTDCAPFDPNEDILKTPTGKCNLARKCNTTWSGFCN